MYQVVLTDLTVNGNAVERLSNAFRVRCFESLVLTRPRQGADPLVPHLFKESVA